MLVLGRVGAAVEYQTRSHEVEAVVAEAEDAGAVERVDLDARRKGAKGSSKLGKVGQLRAGKVRIFVGHREMGGNAVNGDIREAQDGAKFFEGLVLPAP